MNKLLKGFSLAELLISLLVTSMILSATIPTVTRKMKNSNEDIWMWVPNSSDIFAAPANEQTAILGMSNNQFITASGGG